MGFEQFCVLPDLSRQNMKKIVLTGILAVLLLLAATGCGAEPEPELPLVEYTVRFLFDGTVLSEQQVQEHTVPTAPVPVLPGLRFLGWDREITAAEADAEYLAEFVPVLDGHGAYLFPDDRGRIRADEPFTGG